MTPICIQDCRVDSWTETTNGAIRLDVGGPDTIFDCVFTNPPNTNPPVKLGNSSLIRQTVITSSNVSTGTTSVVTPYAYTTITDIPASQRTLGGSITSAAMSFLKETAPAEGTVFDAKRDYGAVGNGSADDTDELRACIAAAKAAGNGAVAYIPSGTYKITGTLTIDGGNYSVCGSGFRTVITWGSGVYTGTMISVVDPQQVRLEQLYLYLPNNDDPLYDNVCRIRQTSATGGPSHMVYDGVFTTCAYPVPRSRWPRGLECDSLPEGAVVVFEQIDGNIDLINCSRARILANIHYGKIKVQGATYAKTGFTGWLTFGSAGDYVIFVKDNQDFVGSDCYIESTDALASITGDSCTTPGRVTMQATKQHIISNFFAGGYTGSKNDATGCFGFEFTVGANPITVTALGRSVSTAMNNSHAVKIWRVSDQTCVASATVLSSSPIDPFGYKNIVITPVTLAANTTYRIVSDETSGGDAWMNLGTVVSHRNTATITQAVSGTQGLYPTSTAGSTNSAYGLPTFYIDTAPEIAIDNYTGRVSWGKGIFIDTEGTPAFPINHTGTRSVDLLLVGNGFLGADPTSTITESGSGMTKHLLGNLWRNPDQSVPANYGVVSDITNANTNGLIANVLDDFAELGRLDLSLNFSGLVPRTTNQKLWLTADTGVTKDGANYISAWADQSGKGNNATAGGGSQDPLYQATALNGKPTINFDGAYNNFMLGSHYLFADNTKTGISFIAVVKSTADKTNTLANLLDFGTPESGLGGYVFEYDTNYAGAMWRGPGGVPDYGRAGYTHSKGSAYVIYTGVIKFGAVGYSTNTVRLNGLQVNSTTSSYALTQFTSAEISEAATRAGNSGPVSIAMQSKLLMAERNLQGDIAEMLWYDSAFSSTDALEVERYLSKKWGISLEGTADILPPAAVTDLTTTASTDTTVTMQWTAPGDDGSIGTATSYDVRYSTSPITLDNWASATTVTGEPTPAAAGTVQSMTVTGLTSMTTYYFAIRATDDGGCVNELSNVPNRQTLVPQAELKLWLKADAGVTKDGSNYVTAWADQSGQGNDATNGGSTERPLYVGSALNGYPVIRFDGAYNNFMLGSHYLFADNTKTGISFIAVVKSTADKTNTLANLLDFGTPESGLGGYVFEYDTNYAGAMWRGPGGVPDYGRAGYTHSKGSAYVIYTGVIKFGAVGYSTNTVRLNGLQVNSTTSSYALTQFTSAEISEAATRAGNSGPVSIAMQSKLLMAERNLQGDIAEMLWYSSALSSTDAYNIEAYLGEKYGITLDQ
ncbi:MAG: fibronectin type III domain-containing protein [Armatimonadota bacterium]